MIPRDLQADLAIWTKGFSVTRGSPEFQLVIPSSKKELRGLESSIEEAADWPVVLHGLYQLTDRDLAYERCLLISDEDAVLVTAGPMVDRHGRRVVAICSAHFSVDWSDPNLYEVVAKAHGLSVRLLDVYTSLLTDNDANPERQLQKGKLLPRRSFFLGQEQMVAVSEWGEVLDAVREVRGVKGVATPRLLLLGANVVLGTQHEAEVLRARKTSVDGYIAPRSHRLVSMSDNIVPWPHRRTSAQENLEENRRDQREGSVESERTEARRRQVNRTISDAEKASHDFVDAWVKVVRDFFNRLLD